VKYIDTNITLFGLEEDKNEILSEKVGDVFVSVGEKPSFVTSRLGNKAGSKARPVKVTLTGTDMSPHERARHKQLVMVLKSKISNQPDKRHFIRQ
jgi:hypothetical protein